MFHPLYGDLMTAKEVSDATLFTLNQLRNWRNDARAHLAPFGSVQLGGTSYYRRIVVQDYLDENGTQVGSYRMTDRDKKFPLGESVAQDLEKIDAMANLSKLTTETVSHWLNKQLDNKVSFINTWKEFWALTGKPYISSNDKSLNSAWYEGAVQTHRLFVNDIQGLGLSVEQVLSIPVGAVPPIKERS